MRRLSNSLRFRGYQLSAFLAALVLVAVGLTEANAQDAKVDLWNAVRENRVAPDHVAHIGDFDYEIFVNRMVTPPVAVARITSESMDRITSIKGKKGNEVMDRQVKL